MFDSILGQSLTLPTFLICTGVSLALGVVLATGQQLPRPDEPELWPYAGSSARGGAARHHAGQW